MAFTNAYCTEPDVERWLQQPIDADTKPSLTEASMFAESRASVLSSLCAGWGYTVTPATVTSGSRIEDLLRDANAIGAAADYGTAQQFGRAPGLSERTERLTRLWIDYIGGTVQGSSTEKVGYIEKEIKFNLASLASDHIISGDTLADPTATTPYNTPIGIGMGDEF